MPGREFCEVESGMNQNTVVRRAMPGDGNGIAQVHVKSWRTTYSGIVHADVLDGLSVEARAAFWSRQTAEPNPSTFLHVAVDSHGRIVGFVSGGPERDSNESYQSELYAIYILASHQGQGLGKRLVAALVSDHLVAGFSTMLVWVLAENPAREFYASLGGREVGSKWISMGPDRLEEVALGWNDLELLASRLSVTC